MSNYFARFSPDGKWIVFCKAKSFMLLQPDSELYIVPAQGGEARRLRCNTSRMNSWHSWSRNGKWLVFSSKARSSRRPAAIGADLGSSAAESLSTGGADPVHGVLRGLGQAEEVEQCGIESVAVSEPLRE